MTRVVALVEHADHVCCRYRLRAFIPILARAGYLLELVVLPRSILQRWRVIRNVAKASIVVIQRKLLSAIEVRYLRLKTRNLWYDFDDAVWMRDSYSEKGFFDARRQNRFQFMMRYVDLALAGNSFLSDTANHVRGEGYAVVIPTCIEVARYHPPASISSGSSQSLVWIGSSSTLQGLRTIRAILESIGQQFRNLRLAVICDAPLELQYLPVDFIPWSETTEAEAIARCQIGISWIPDDPWSRGKCGLKILQYMAAGLPVIANRVGVHPEMVVDGITGDSCRY